MFNTNDRNALRSHLTELGLTIRKPGDKVRQVTTKEERILELQTQRFLANATLGRKIRSLQTAA